MPTGTGRRVLFVDDDELLEEFVEEQLAPIGYAITIADSVRAAGDLLASESFDAIVLAPHLAEDKLAATVQNWKTMDPFARILLVTNSPPHPRPPEVFRILPRPFTLGDFHDAVVNPFAIV
jgi:DNA-binding NtrC family response regulator